MNVTMYGFLAAVQKKYPEKGQNFDPHQILSVTQIEDEKLDVHYIKDMDINRKHTENQHVRCDLKVTHWQMGTRGGLSVKLVDIQPASAAPKKAAA